MLSKFLKKHILYLNGIKLIDNLNLNLMNELKINTKQKKLWYMKCTIIFSVHFPAIMFQEVLLAEKWDFLSINIK
jgi:hypothetical protein